MASTSRAALAATALLASFALAQAADRAAFETVPDERADLTPLTKDAPEPAAGQPAAMQPAAIPRAADAAPSGKGRKGGKRASRLARRAAPTVAAAALKATVPPAAPPPLAPAAAEPGPAAPPTPAPKALAANTEAPAATPHRAEAPSGPREAASGTVAELLAKHAAANGVPLRLAQAVVRIESRGNVHASHAGALGLMQIKYGTARAAGFGGPAVGLFVADTNLRYGMKILGQAYKAAKGDTCGALMRYQSGHLSTHPNAANRAYCSKARAFMASGV